ncbi:ABC drug exporter AbcA [Exophiala viscosa]|uniref:ABC drug exporter AbcA n=1 Tax=Exophiala viscosa TaxID=2486360 RepID=A0AAN6DYM1_9EURO|nr:ABC drug exporter AbcA [Exophiala viscosa]KAI1624062.1 ABC drug exporter AbcA [Exophiala viscosa]
MSTFLAGNITTNYDRSRRMAGASSESPAADYPYEDRTFHSDGGPVLGDGQDENKEVRDLARSYSRASGTEPQFHPFDASGADSEIDPNSDNFNGRAWTKAMLRLQKMSGQENVGRKAGFAFRNLSAFGFTKGSDFQRTVDNYALAASDLVRGLFGHKGRRVDILRNFEGVVQPGEMLVVLGPPGSGCSTFLKTIAGETHGFTLSDDSYINYQGISYKKMHHDFRGEAIYTAEQDIHFPMLTVGDTLLFASRARTPQHMKLPEGVTKKMYAAHLRDVVMATFGIRHTISTKVGNDFVRGVSGGERKRVSIAEATLSGAPLQCWDNSTRGLDSANAIEFCKTLRTSTDLNETTAAVAIYQAPQSAYNYFDKVLVLYQGRQIYFGRTTDAKQYFLDMGFDCPKRQTVPDFLTSMTNPIERIVMHGHEKLVPRTPDEFVERWQKSEQRQKVLTELEGFEAANPIGGPNLEAFQHSRRIQQSKVQRASSPYTLSYAGQINLCLWRGFKRLADDPSITITQLAGNCINALVVSSLFYNLQANSDSLRSRSSLIFFAVLLNAFGSALEILTLYAQRPIVEKHKRYALYHPSAEAFASMLTDIPAKTLNAIGFNLILYFMTNLRRTPGAFFFFLFTTYILTLTMSMLFRFIASVSRSLIQALVPTAVLMIAIVVYTGFVIPVTYMHGWARWMNYINPTAYGFEALMVNEMSHRQYPCSTFIPPAPQFGDGSTTTQICSGVAAAAGQPWIDGDAYINSAYQYYRGHKWRDIGIMFVFMLGLLVFYLIATETVSAKKSKGEVLLFRRGHKPAFLKERPTDDESGNLDEALALERQQTKDEQLERQVSAVIQRQTAIFQWKDVCYDIKIKGNPRRILDHVDGWVKPGTMTALMGVSGAGKTTLLDCLATRVTMGVITGEMLVDGRQRDESFQRKTGYVQQQDLHLETSTVREALRFSALLRQSRDVPRAEKLAYVEEVIKLLDMQEYADAVVGVPGEGLNVEQRKRLTIGVELAARPQLLLFLDEPTSGLDSQTSWSILNLLEKLTHAGQAILCTIHQPSAILFQRFDRLLLLAAGGKTVYFGPVGRDSHILINYFQKNGAPACPPGANPAEYMLEAIGAAPGSHTEVNWFEAWKQSPEYQEVHRELEEMKVERSQIEHPSTSHKSDYFEFAAPFTMQFWEVQRRVFEQYWRTPVYIYSKMLLCALTGLFIGFSLYKAPNTEQGLQNQLFGIFMLLVLFSQLVQQIMPLFVTQRSLYEARERPSKTYDWKAFMLSNILVELPWATLGGVVLFFCWYYPIGLYKNASYTNSVHSRGGLEFLFVWEFLMFSSTFAHLMIAGIATAEAASNLANVLFSLCLLFNGVLVGPKAMPGFWIFMYRVSPFTYLVEGLLAVGVANAPVTCADNELLHFRAPSGETCGTYLKSYISEAGGYLIDSNASQCEFCTLDNTNTFLELSSISFDHRWRDFGIIFVYIAFNILAATAIYWLARVPKGKKYAGKDDKKGLVKTESHAEKEKRVDGDLENGGSTGSSEAGHLNEKTVVGDGAAVAATNAPKQEKEAAARNEPLEKRTVNETSQPSTYVQATRQPETQSTSVGGAAVSTAGRPSAERFVTAREF